MLLSIKASRSIICLLVFNICTGYCQETFQVPFQKQYNGSSPPSINEWIELDSNNITSVREFTVCNWIRQRYFNQRISLQLWSYCTLDSKDSEMECVAAYMESSSKSLHRDVIIHFDIRFNNTALHTAYDIHQFYHRKWVHLCLSFSSTNGEQRTYYNGEQVGYTQTVLNDSSVILRGSGDGVIDSSFIFGQEPDEIRARFEAYQAFIGDLAELNVWNRILKNETILQMAQCMDWSVGNIVSWKKSNIKAHNVEMQDISNGSVFCQDTKHFIIFPRKVALGNAKMTCKVHGGKVAVPSTKEENDLMVSIAMKHKEKCIVDENKISWIGVIRRNHVWYEFDNNKTIGESYSNFNSISPFPNKDCAFLRPDGSWDSAWGSFCKSGVALCTICAINNTPIFTLKGTCTLSYIDWNYYLSLDREHRIQYFEGYKDTYLLQSNEDMSWTFRERDKTQQTYTNKLITRNSFDNSPIGRQNWLVTEPRCGYEQSRNILTLSTCKFDTQFTCNSGDCIDLQRRCDEIKDCEDQSDEIDCNLIDMPTSYVKTHYPPPTSKGGEILLFTDVEITNVHLIDTINMHITLTTKIHMRWKDPRLKFFNPGMNKNNIVSQENAQKMWIPTDQLILTNAIIGEIRKDPINRVQVFPGMPEDIDSESPYENRRFNGSYNFLEVYQRMKAEYNCTFDVYKFPFDSKKCEFGFRINRRKIQIVEDTKISYDGPTIVEQFEIEWVTSTVQNTEDHTKYIFEIVFKRVFTRQILKTFMPSFLFWTLAYSTIFLDINNSGDRFAGSLTVMLVLVSLLDIVNGDLPETSYMKMIDLWFLWHIGMGFGVTMYHIALRIVTRDMQLDRQTDFEINEEHKSSRQKLNKINRYATIIFPTVNGLFYGIYFYTTIN